MVSILVERDSPTRTACSKSLREIFYCPSRFLTKSAKNAITIADRTHNYLNWFARQGFPKGELGRLLALMQEIDHNGLSSLLEPLRKR